MRACPNNAPFCGQFDSSGSSRREPRANHDVILHGIITTSWLCAVGALTNSAHVAPGHHHGGCRQSRSRGTTPTGPAAPEPARFDLRNDEVSLSEHESLSPANSTSVACAIT